MSIYAMVWAYEQHVEGHGAKFTLVTAAQYANEDGVCWVSQETLSADMDMGLSTVRRHLKHLEEDAKLIRRIERRRKDGTRTSDLIQLLGYTNRSNRAPDTHTTAQNEQNNRSDRAGMKRHRETSSNNSSETNVSSSLAESENSASKKPKKEPVRTLGQEGYARTVDILREAKAKGWEPLPWPEQKEAARFYATALDDGREPEQLDQAVWWLVAKASGVLENEPRAWAYFGTALTRVEEGWSVNNKNGGGPTSYYEGKEKNKDKAYPVRWYLSFFPDADGAVVEQWIREGKGHSAIMEAISG